MVVIYIPLSIVTLTHAHTHTHKAIDSLLAKGSECVIVTSIEPNSTNHTLLLLGKTKKGILLSLCVYV